MAVRRIADVLLVVLLNQTLIVAGAGQAAPTEIPAFLREPGYFIEKQGDKWAVKKPGLRILEAAESRPPRQVRA